MDTQAKVLLLGRIDHATASWESLSQHAQLVKPQSTSRQEFLVELRSGRLDGVVAICDRAPYSLAVTGRFDKELVEALPKSLRFICHNGAGYDNIDVAACSERGISVSNCPEVVDDATADTAVFLILAALRGFNNGIMSIRNRTWTGHVPPGPLGHDPQGKTLGILGLGGIGVNLKRKMEMFGMKVIYHNRSQSSSCDGAEYVSFDDLLARSDVLSLNLPLNADTRNIISTREFEKMKDGIVIVNTARGGVLDEDALVKALDSGKVLSVGLDVYQSEPDIHPGLLSNPHVCMLPHMGTSTVEVSRSE
ncbi:D-3-phosphoglycerate dehydrogenase [Colletotrichum karsti]|uniref:D-3-phosphoglycerate dehydrogenase n=1 Tax=Colletotrichum karsti TaxID=1095194 RepID=A0A9P6I8Y1_9PEZI|nr:D-3-phosphoglycerate dehydrogenase [Colletotrichum karsti]KAF9874210.1 D-3-phosphoglycerate dehydrogenase [Colletotrichum karsti]